MEERRDMAETLSMKRSLGLFTIAVFATLLANGCASQTRAQGGETTPTEALPKGVASALFPDPGWK